MRVSPQVHEEIISSRANIIATLDFTDLTDTTAGQAQTITIFTMPVNALVKHVTLELPTCFQNADTAFDDVTVSVGSDDDVDNFITATEVNCRNGSPAAFPIYDTGDGLPYKNASHKATVTFTPKTGKTLASLTQGAIVILFDMFIPQTGT